LGTPIAPGNSTTWRRGLYTQKRRSPCRHRLHAAALRFALRTRPHPGQGERSGAAQSPALRQVLRPRRPRLQPQL